MLAPFKGAPVSTTSLQKESHGIAELPMRDLFVSGGISNYYSERICMGWRSEIFAVHSTMEHMIAHHDRAFDTAVLFGCLFNVFLVRFFFFLAIFLFYLSPGNS